MVRFDVDAARPEVVALELVGHIHDCHRLDAGSLEPLSQLVLVESLGGLPDSLIELPPACVAAHRAD